MAPIEDNDSGMESQENSQSIDPPILTTSEKKSVAIENGDDEPDETIAERLWGLTEMFPEPIRHLTWNIYVNTEMGIKSFYGLSRNTLWAIFSSSIILFAPVVFEVERLQMQEMQRTQNKQMLLGPNAAVGAGGGALPPLQRQI